MASSRNPEEEPLRSPFPLTPPPALGDEYYPFGGEGQPPFVGEAAAAGAAGEGDPEEADLGVLLQRKEQDLLLAAELGKMLLERNEELERRYDELMKEHLEVKEVTHLEQQLQEDLIVLRAEHRTLTLCNAEHAARMQSLQAENRLLQERKQDMEKQIRQLREENEAIQALVDTLHENLLLLRKESREKQLRSITHGISKIGCTPKKASLSPEENLSEYTKKVSALSYQQQDILAQKEIEIAKLQDQVTLQHVELSGLKAEIENQRRLYQESNRDKALKLARDSLSQQLLRVIRQKMALSQELEAWQDDIQYIIHQQLLQKQQEERHCLTPPPKPPTQGKGPELFRAGASMPSGTGFFSFFRKS
ncbi:hypothetical protein E2320_003288 [Naja naja]|nr:hypothetical protein E2320_003288 [Naja naja]